MARAGERRVGVAVQRQPRGAAVPKTYASIAYDYDQILRSHTALRTVEVAAAPITVIAGAGTPSRTRAALTGARRRTAPCVGLRARCAVWPAAGCGHCPALAAAVA